MALINCPSCNNKISNKTAICPTCDYKFDLSVEELERLKVLNFRKYRDKMYQLKMFTYFAIAIAVTGVVPMFWSYAKAIDYGFNVSILNHWGIYLVVVGFILYVIARVMMLLMKRKHRKSNLGKIK